MENLSTKQKVVAGVGLAATAVAAALAFSWWTKKHSHEDSDSEEVDPSIEKEPDAEDLAKSLKDEGNAAFKERKFEKAIQFYTRAAEVCTKEKWIYFGNRSAAYLNMKDYQNAFDDARKCIELNPEWAKGHFRAGKALMEEGKYSEAFKFFYKATLLEPSNETATSLQSAREKVSPAISVRDSEAIIRNLTNEKQQKEWANLCGTTPVDLLAIIKQTKEGKLMDHPDIKSAAQKDEAALLKVLSALIFAEELSNQTYFPVIDELREIIRKKYSDDADLASSSALLCALRSELDGAVENLRKSAELSGYKNAQIIHDWLSFVKLKAQATQDQNALDGLELSALAECFNCPNVHTPTISEMIIPIWLRSFADPELINELNQVESEKQGKSEEQALRLDYEALCTGKFNEHFTKAPFVRALSDVTINNMNFERMLGPYRRAALLYAENNSAFDKASPFLVGLALQNYLGSWSWTTSTQEFEEAESAKRSLEETIQNSDPNSLVKDGVIDKAFLVKLVSLAMFLPLSEVKGLAPLLKKADLSKLKKKQMRQLVKNTVLNPAEEEEIEQSIVPVTPIDQNSKQYLFRNQTVFKHWEHPGPFSNNVRVNPIKHISILFPEVDFSDLERRNPLEVLFVPSGSGNMAYKYLASHEDVKVTGLEVSPKNVAFASRQISDLKVDNLSFVQGDATQVDENSFGGKQFDIIVEKELSNYVNTQVAVTSLAKVLKPGGIFKLCGRRKEYIDYIVRFRKIFKTGCPSLFDSSNNMARFATNQELNEMRSRLFFDDSQQPQEADLQFVLMNMPFTVPDFSTIYLQPNQIGFTFKSLEELVLASGLEFLGFELVGLTTTDVLQYQVVFPDDPNMKNGEHLDEFYSKYSSLNNFEITAVARKPSV